MDNQSTPEPQKVELDEEFLTKGIALGIGLNRREVIVVRPNVFKDNLYLSIRKFSNFKGQITFPTRKGIEIPWNEARAVISAIERVIENLEESGSTQISGPQEELPF